MKTNTLKNDNFSDLFLICNRSSSLITAQKPSIEKRLKNFEEIGYLIIIV
jgi:hypothetical protein